MAMQTIGSRNDPNSAFDHRARSIAAAKGASMVSSSLEVVSTGHFKANVFNRGSSQWFEIQDLFVAEVSPQTVALSESYLLVYEKKH